MDTKKRRLPRAMVLVFEPAIGHSFWVDFEFRARTLNGLERKLKDGIKAGEWVAWRLIHVEKEVMGNVD